MVLVIQFKMTDLVTSVIRARPKMDGKFMFGNKTGSKISIFISGTGDQTMEPIGSLDLTHN
jgi:hypothetical protein